MRFLAYSLLVNKGNSIITLSHGRVGNSKNTLAQERVCDSKDTFSHEVGRALIFKPEYKERILRIWEDTPSTPSTPSIQDHL